MASLRLTQETPTLTCGKADCIGSECVSCFVEQCDPPLVDFILLRFHESPRVRGVYLTPGHTLVDQPPFHPEVIRGVQSSPRGSSIANVLSLPSIEMNQFYPENSPVDGIVSVNIPVHAVFSFSCPSTADNVDVLFGLTSDHAGIRLDGDRMVLLEGDDWLGWARSLVPWNTTLYALRPLVTEIVREIEHNIAVFIKKHEDHMERVYPQGSGPVVRGYHCELLQDFFLKHLCMLSEDVFDRSLLSGRLLSVLDCALFAALFRESSMEEAFAATAPENTELFHGVFEELQHCQFEALLARAKLSIALGVSPQLISAGSSGSYFVRDLDGSNIAVFKPRDEEPYGDNNPKKLKRAQRCLFPCFFGRSFLLKQQGYLSEAGASLVDVAFRLYVVPRTQVISLVSPVFNHPGDVVAEKTGSFQLFLRGFSTASTWLAQNQLSPEEVDDFDLQFENLCILDYIIRNTDRNLDNWMVRREARPEGFETYTPRPRRLFVGAIDNGLAFPFKTPAQCCRTFDFPWGAMDSADKPFSEETRRRVLPRIENHENVLSLVRQLRSLMGKDPQFDLHLFEDQMAVMLGQLQNVYSILREADRTPRELANLQPQHIALSSVGPDWLLCAPSVAELSMSADDITVDSIRLLKSSTGGYMPMGD